MKRLKPTSILTASTLLMLLTIAALLSGCGSGGQKTTSPEAVRIITEASQKKDYIRVVLLADSLENAHVMSEGESYYWQGHAYYRLLQRRAAEFYWKESMKATENLTDTASLGTYAKSASYLTSLYIRYLDFPNALKVVKPALEHLDSRKYTASSDYTNLLIFEGCCQAHFNAQDSVVNPIFERAYNLHISNIKKNPTKEAYRSAVAGIINIAYGWLSEKRYEQGLMWTERLGNLIEEYKQLFDNDESYIEKQWARYKIFSAIGLEGIGKLDQAAEAFVEYQKTRFAYTIEGQLDASNYLAMSGRWKEAADQLLNLDEFFDHEQTGTSLEDIQRYLLKKYHVNTMAGLKDSAFAVANQICERLDSAIIRSQWLDSEEQETIHQKEEQIQQQQENLLKTRVMVLVVTVIALIVFFVIFTIIRQRAAKRLAKVEAVKERMEGELSIARDIQMSMVPSSFPKIDGLDMYASMTPAKEVGGDLYSFLQKGDLLYFCIGDVSGKGVPASLFMAQATRLFHTLASQVMSPAEIAINMNTELAENNEQLMFVTMFICRLNLKLNVLEYCNAGHNPPVIGNADGQFSFLEMKPNSPIGLWPGLDYVGESIDDFSNRLLLLYTDGLNEAENTVQEQFGDEQIVKLLSAMSSNKAQDIIEKLKSEVERFRNGAEPNDDLTMMCVRYSSIQPV